MLVTTANAQTSINKDVCFLPLSLPCRYTLQYATTAITFTMGMQSKIEKMKRGKNVENVSRSALKMELNMTKPPSTKPSATYIKKNISKSPLRL